MRPLPKMIYIPGGDFTMGSDHHYAEEKPAHRVKVGGFWIDNAPVTNAEFKHFDSEEKDGKCNPGFDGWRRNVDVVESCEGQSDAVGKGEGSDGLHQHPAVLHEQKQSEYEQQTRVVEDVPSSTCTRTRTSVMVACSPLATDRAA